MGTLDTIFDLFRSERRRYVLYYLHDRDEPVAVDELVALIDEWEADPPPDIDREKRFDRIKISLQQTHLPKIADVDVIEYDREEGIVQARGFSPEFEVFVAIARVIEQPATDE